MTNSPKKKNNYQWQGIPVEVIFGRCLVHINKEKPLWWYNFECHKTGKAKIAALKIIYVDKHGKQEFCIANHYGIGILKLLNGGWPNCNHFSLPLDTFLSNKEDKWWYEKTTLFDEAGYSAHEAARILWQKETHPEEYERNQRFKKSFAQNKPS